MTRSQILTYISNLDGWLSLHEGFFLYESARNGKGKGEIVEIGSWMGKSTICLAGGSESKKRERVFAIDPHKGQYTRNNGIGKKSPTFKKFLSNIQVTGLLSYIKPLVTTSKNAAKNWKKPIRLLFIDGLHDYKNTVQDFTLWSPFVSTNGIIAFHDAFCGHIGPERVILENVLQSEWRDIGVVGSIIFVQKGKPKDIMQYLNLFRHRILIPLALKLNKSDMSKGIKFFLIHRIIKLLLLNPYTLLFQESDAILFFNRIVSNISNFFSAERKPWL